MGRSALWVVGSSSAVPRAARRRCATATGCCALGEYGKPMCKPCPQPRTVPSEMRNASPYQQADLRSCRSAHNRCKCLLDACKRRLDRPLDSTTHPLYKFKAVALETCEEFLLAAQVRPFC